MRTFLLVIEFGRDTKGNLLAFKVPAGCLEIPNVGITLTNSGRHAVMLAADEMGGREKLTFLFEVDKDGEPYIRACIPRGAMVTPPAPLPVAWVERPGRA